MYDEIGMPERSRMQNQKNPIMSAFNCGIRFFQILIILQIR